MEISARKTGLEVTVDEMVYVVRQYIKARRNVCPEISIFARKVNHTRVMISQLRKLHYAFEVASIYFLNQK